MIRDQVRKRAHDRNVRVFRAYLAEEYDGIGQYVLVTLARSSSSASFRTRVAAGDIASEKHYPKGSPVIAFSKRGNIEIGLGAGDGAGPL